MKTTKGKCVEILANDSNKYHEEEILGMKDSHVLLYRVTHTFVGDLYIAMNRYEYAVLNAMKDVEIYNVPDFQKARFDKGRIIHPDFSDSLDYEEQLETFLEDGACSGIFSSLSVGGFSGVVSLLYQLLNITKLALGAILVDTYPVYIENITLQSQMGLHISYIKITLNDNRVYFDRCVLFEEDYKFSYRYLFSKLLRMVM